MKVLIISDTHGLRNTFDAVIEKEQDIDMLIHLGDVERDEDYIQSMVKCPAIILSGNNDFFSQLPTEREITIGDYKVFLTHGHSYYVSIETKTLRRVAMAKGANIVMFGHTHKPYMDVDGDIKIINPGSISYPRQEGRKNTYIIMEMDKEGNLHFELKNV
jgi:putative phosphoesterase